MTMAERTFARQIGRKHYRIKAYRCAVTGNWRQRSLGPVTPEEAAWINEELRLRRMLADLPSQPLELLAAYVRAVSDVGLILGAIDDRLEADARPALLGAVAVFGQAHDRIVVEVMAKDLGHLRGQVGRAASIAQTSWVATAGVDATSGESGRADKQEVNVKEGEVAGDETTAVSEAMLDAEGVCGLSQTPEALEGVRDLVQGYNQMSRGLDALAKVVGEGYGPVERMQKLAEVIYTEMGKLRGFVETD